MEAVEGTPEEVRPVARAMVHKIVHLMSFVDEEAERIHRSTPHVKKFVEILYPNCDEAPAFVDLTLVRSTQY